jgi:hypothetical protein
MVSSTSTSTSSSLLGVGSSGARPARAVRNREATASSWRTWPKVNARRNEPSVEGAYARSKTRPIPPCRSIAMSSIESAPATIPATSEDTFNPALAPLSVGTLNRSSASRARPTESANAMTGTNPAAPIRFGSSKTAVVAPRL